LFRHRFPLRHGIRRRSRAAQGPPPLPGRRAIPNLFDPLTLGALSLPNRIVMAPLTRGRAGRDGVHGPLAVDYYRQRAAAGLIITEATGISREGLGWPYAPGLWSAAQVEGWKPITVAVHETGGRIVAQLWHMGRLVHSSFGGGQPISASATTAPHHAHTYDGNQPYEEARPATLDDIKRIISDYAAAARNAMTAGFDGVQIHGANGYLVDQFLRASANHRTGGDRRGRRRGRDRADRDSLLAQYTVAGHRRSRARATVHRPRSRT
jgi:2,4-dienoyl-CoA reductase-like NADH-dependent reductase (Old Yellow Enzyme family)